MGHFYMAVLIRWLVGMFISEALRPVRSRQRREVPVLLATERCGDRHEGAPRGSCTKLRSKTSIAAAGFFRENSNPPKVPLC